MKTLNVDVAVVGAGTAGLAAYRAAKAAGATVALTEKSTWAELHKQIIAPRCGGCHRPRNPPKDSTA